MIDICEEVLTFTPLANLTTRIPGGRVRCEPVSEDAILVVVPTYEGNLPFWTELYVYSSTLNMIPGLMEVAMQCAVQHAQEALITIPYESCNVEKSYVEYGCSFIPSMMLIKHVWPDIAQHAWEATVRQQSNNETQMDPDQKHPV